MLLVDLQVRTNLIKQTTPKLTTTFSVYLYFSIHRDTQVIKWNSAESRRVNDDGRDGKSPMNFLLVVFAFRLIYSTTLTGKTITSRMNQKLFALRADPKRLTFHFDFFRRVH